MANGKERRKYPRSLSSVSLKKGGEDGGILNHVDNISANGVLCHTAKPIPLMTRMRIQLDLPEPNHRTIDAEGVTVRCEPHDQGEEHFRVAILFTKIEDADHDAIRKFVEHDIAQHAGAAD